MLLPNNKAKETLENLLVASRYNIQSNRPDGSVVLLNTLSGSIVMVSGKNRDDLLRLIEAKRVSYEELKQCDLVDLIQGGFFVPSNSNEKRQMFFLHSHITSNPNHLQLILFPTEQCNFRCIYCYESFEKNKMEPHIIQSVENLLIKRIPKLSSLELHWFGGEPLLALDVIENICITAKSLAHSHSCRYSSHITTNAYHLTQDVATRLIDLGIVSYQITVDGVREDHNKRRKLHSDPSAGTFDIVMNNLISLLKIREIFTVCIRVNYDLDSIDGLPAFLEFLATVVGDDPRVRVDFAPIWADPDKVPVSICLGKERQKTMVGLFQKAHSLGLKTNVDGAFEPSGQVCYAAKVNSLVIRSDGALNKCTVALDADYNHVGQLSLDGSVQLDMDRFALWTNSGIEEDKACQNCWMAPSCQGNACPLERIENEKRPCPVTKNYPAQLLPLIVE